MPLYMKWGAGPDIKGEVSETGHLDWLALDSASFSVGRSTNFQVGSGQEKRHRDQPTVSDLQLSRTYDAASPLLFNACVAGVPTNVQIDFLEPAKGADKPPNVVLSYYLRDCLISSYSVGGGGGGASESLALNFTGINIEYIPYDADDAPQASKKGMFDLVTAKQSWWK
ncbi:MAG TPA: type VI secretion system tube protein Hcp [Gemmataceae bacterium]|nr:type VI secretion system tube protein Hcp [Gemmataceae bacterium]